MKTIGERAKDYADNVKERIFYSPNDLSEYDIRDAFIEGAKSERAELTRWNDPKEVLPKPMEYVLCKCVSGIYVVDFFDPRLGAFFCEDATYAKVVGWRPIHE